MKRQKEETKEEIEISVLKSKIEIVKTGFDRYVETLTRSAFIETCTGGAFFNKMFHNLLKNGFEHIRDVNLAQKKKDELNVLFFGKMFGDDTSEKGLLETNLKHWESLENWAKDNLTNLNEDLKKKIVIDSIEQQQLWSKQFDKNSKLYKKIKEIKKVKTKTIKKTKLKK